ncbi:MAG: acyltransferase [Prevotella sp.]|nr:acyltransferase [Prevotella sp.]
MTEFEDIRPYYDSEIPAAMQRITETDAFPLLASWIFPGRDINEVKQMMRSFQTIREFQLKVMVPVNEQVVKRSIDKLTFNGFDRLRPDTDYLFVSNHRDIMLDASLLQYLFAVRGRDTTEITFGANLMSPGLVTDIGKSNKMFRVERGGKLKDFYMSSRHLSDYIRYTIRDKHQSVWIAQRNGRTKDGNDHTDQGIIKMFCMSCPEDKIKALSELHIVPMSISYEWESCDILKAIELYESRSEKYIKKPGEDLNSILTGIVQRKGRVTITLCDEVTEADLRQFDHCTNNEYHRAVALLLDERINNAYQLYPNNYIAHDLRYGQTACRDHYTDEQKAAFLHYMDRLNKYDVDEPDVLKDIFLGIYANPVRKGS